MEDGLAAERDGAEKLAGLLDLMPDFAVKLLGVGVEAKRRQGLDFEVVSGRGTVNWIDVQFRGARIYQREIMPTNAGPGDTITLQGAGAGQIADAIYDAIERGALLNERVE